MRKFCTKLVAGILFSILLSGVSFFGIAHAANVGAPTFSNGTYTFTYIGQDQNGESAWTRPGSNTHFFTSVIFPNGVPADYIQQMSDFDAGIFGTAAQAATPSQAAKDQAVLNGSTSNNFSVSGLADFGFGIANFIVNGVALATIASTLYLITIVLASLVALAGSIFDLALHFSVFQIGDLFNNLGVLNNLWGLVRDIINVTFIFMLLYVAITMILGDVLSVKKKPAVTSIIVSALFINFSMFFAKILIDFGNIIAIALYNRIIVLGATGITISNLFMGNLGIKDLFGVFSISGQTNIIVMLVLQIGFLLALIWAFCYGALVFIGRIVELIFLVVTSPIAFVGSSIPWLQDERNKWWDSFTNQVLVAPIFMFFVLVVLSLYTELQKALGLSLSVAQALDATHGFDIPRYFYYVIMITLLLDGMKRVKKMSDGAAELVWKGVKGVGTVAAGLATGGVSAAVGKGLFAGGDMAAGRAVLGGKNPYLARLANFGSNLGNLPKTLPGVWQGSKNGFKDVPGAAGMAVRGIQDSAFGAIKSGTGGMVDVGALQKSLDASTKAKSDRVIAAAGKAGEKADAGIKSAKDTKANVDNQAKDQMRNGSDEDQQALRDHNAATSEHGSIEKAQAKGVENLSKATDVLNEFMKKQEEARKIGDLAASAKANADYTEQAKKVAEIKEQNEKVNKANARLIEVAEQTAKSMGIGESDTGEKDANGNAILSRLKTIDIDLKKANDSKVLANKSRNETIAQLRATKGVVQGFEKFGLAFESDRKKLAGQMAAQGGYNSKEKKDKEKFEKLYKAVVDEKDGGEEKPAETTTPTPPKA